MMIELILALGLGLIAFGLAALLVALVATQRFKRQVLIFPQRFALYIATKELIEAVLVRNDLTDATLLTYAKAIASAPFLLDAALRRDLEELPRQVLSLRRLKEQMIGADGTQAKLDIAQATAQVSTQITDFAASLEDRFAPVLKLAQH